MAVSLHVFYYLLIIFIFLEQVATINQDQDYTESLIFKQLPDYKTLAIFEHKISWKNNPVLRHSNHDNSIHHYGIFPRPIAQVMYQYNVQELHLSLTRGKWNTGVWGYPSIDVPPGVEFWAWFQPDTNNVDGEWSGLLHSMSGITCTSLDAVTSSDTYQPKMSFKPEGALLNGSISSSYLRYTALPREPVCTENLTPWSKLLPCGQKAGISSLYNALKLYDTVYHSLNLKVVPTCQDVLCSTVGMVLTQSLTVVFQLHKDTTNWSLSSLFSKRISTSCPLSSQSLIFIDDISNLHSKGVELTPPPIGRSSDNQSSVYDLHDTSTFNATNPLDIRLSWKEPYRQILPHSPLLSIRRFVTGSGHERGGLTTIITNRHTYNTLTVSLLDMTPWFIRLLYHTLHINCQTIKNEMNCNNSDSLIINHNFVPAKDRKRPYTLEYTLSLPPQSIVTMNIEFLRGFLKWNEHPPDASHGFFINSAVLTAAVSSCPNCTFSPLTNTTDKDYVLLKIHSEPLLVSLPIPDFSMPYNVICFVSTVVAIGFGSLFNLTTRKLGPAPTEEKPSLIKRLLNYFTKRN